MPKMNIDANSKQGHGALFALESISRITEHKEHYLAKIIYINLQNMS